MYKKLSLALSLAVLCANCNLMASEQLEDNQEQPLIQNLRGIGETPERNIFIRGLRALIPLILGNQCMGVQGISDEEQQEVLEQFGLMPIGRQLNLADIKHTQCLNLSQKKVSRIPEGIWKLGFLQEVYLTHNKLAPLPDGIWALKNLTVLTLGAMNLSSISHCIRNLTNLEKLDLSRNALKEIPDSLGNLKKLKELDLSRNALDQIPDSLGNLVNLKALDLSHNFFTSIPVFIEHLHAITEMRFSRNQISTLPEFLAKLENLDILDLSHNFIENIPPFLENGFIFRLADFSDNHIPEVPHKAFKAFCMMKQNIANDNYNEVIDPHNLVLGSDAYERYMYGAPTILPLDFPIIVQENELPDFLYYLWRFASPEFREIIKVIETLPLPIWEEITPNFLTTTGFNDTKKDYISNFRNVAIKGAIQEIFKVSE